MSEESITPAEPWADDLTYRQGVVDLLGILGYGALSAFERLADDGRMAPELADKVHVATMAARQVAHFERVRSHLAGYDVDIMDAMKPFHAAFDAYHSYTKPKDWLEGLLKTYVGDGIAADFYREVAAFVDSETRSLVHEVLADAGHADFVVEKVRAAISADAKGRTPGTMGTSPGRRGVDSGSAGGRQPRRAEQPPDRNGRPSRPGSGGDQQDVHSTHREPRPPHVHPWPAVLIC